MGRRATLSDKALSSTREPRTLSIPLWSVNTCPYGGLLGTTNGVAEVPRSAAGTGGSTSGNCHSSCRSLHARQYATAVTSTATTAVEKMAMMMDEGVMGAGSGGSGGDGRGSEV